MRMQKIRPWLTSLYPRDWRERYGSEFDALLEESLRSPMDIVDVFLGALDAHLQLLNGENVNWRTMNTTNKLRTTILIVFAAFIGIVVAGVGLMGLADDSPMVPLMQTNLGASISWHVIETGATIAILAMLIGGAPLGIRLIRQAFKVNRRILPLLLVPVIAFVLFAAYFAIALLVVGGTITIPGVEPVVHPGSFPPGNRLFTGGLLLVFVLGAIASTWAVWKAVTRAEEGEETGKVAGKQAVELYRFAFTPAVFAAVGMLIVLAGTVAWGIISFGSLPQLFTGNYGPWQTSTQPWFFAISAMMLVCTAAAFAAVARGKKVLGSS